MNKQLKQVKAMFKKMKLIDVLFVVALLLILYHFLSNRASNEHFVDYSPQDNEVNLVLFYAEWCPHCQRLEPIWDKLANDLDGEQIEGKNVHVIKIDCANQKNKDTCQKNDVSSYPTIKCFTANNVQEYEGKRTYNALETFLHNVIKNM